MSKIEKMNEARMKSRLKSEALARVQELNLYKNQLGTLKQRIEELEKEISQKEDTKQDYLIENPILNDLLNNHSGEYAPETYNLCLQVNSLSTKIYSLLVQYINFPPKAHIEDVFQRTIDDIPRELTTLTEINSLVDLWKAKFFIPKGEKIDACLAVDALYFDPEVKITKLRLLLLKTIYTFLQFLFAPLEMRYLAISK